MTEKKIMINKEDAQKQIDILTKYYDVDLDFVPEKSKAIVESILANLLKNVCKGRLEISEGDVLVVKMHLRERTIEFEPLGGRAKVAMGKASEDEHDRVYHLLGYLCKEGSIVIENLTGAYLSCAESLGMFFLQV